MVHRDIKPGNLLVTKSGVPKLLDFGVAKILNPDVLSGAKESIGTFAGAMTPDYASPEQISGGLVTEASDVYSLGVLLYELLTGERPKSKAGRRADSRAAATEQDRRRTRSASRSGRHRADGDAAGAGQALSFRGGISKPTSTAIWIRVPSAQERAACTIAPPSCCPVTGPPSRSLGLVVALAAAGVVTWQVRSRTLGSAQPQIVPVTSMPGSESQPYFSPDGKKIVYVWSGENGENPDLYVQSLEDGSVRRFTTDPAEDLSPVWSPDGTRIAWLRTGRNETAVFVASVTGGIHGKVADVYPIRVEAVGRHLDWSPDGEYLAVPDQVAARGAVPYRR